MVWPSIGLCTMSELHALVERGKAEISTANALTEAANNRAAMAEARYDALVERIRVKAAKPDDGIIHAKNSGDVRRLFEQQVASQQAEREKREEN
jgi:hypothetical protein